MDIFFQKLDFGKYLNGFSLNFKLKHDSQLYEKKIRFHKRTFAKFTLILSILIIILIFIFASYLMKNYENIVTMMSFMMGALILNFLANYVKSIFILDIYYGVFILAFNLIIVEIYCPLYLALLIKDREHFQDPSYYWICLFTGIHIKTIMSIMNVAKIKWYIIGISHVILNFLVMKEYFHLLGINVEIKLGGNLMAISMSSFFLPVIISYLDEKSYKELFISLNRTRENLSSFEILIDQIIPSQIIILDAINLNVLYSNSKTKTFFNNPNNKELVQSLTDIQILLDQKTNLLKLSEQLINDDFNKLEDQGVGRFSNYTGTLVKAKKELDSSKELAGVDTIYLDIDIGIILWKNEKAVLVLLNDVTSKMKIQQINQINEYKDNILASVSHDLRTPLNSMMGFLEIMAEEIKAKRILKYIGAIQSSSKLLLFLVNSIIDYSLMMNKKLILKVENFYVHEILNEILKIITIRLKKKKLDFELKICKQLEKLKVKGDKQRVQQVLLNMLENAIKFTFIGKISLEIFIDDCSIHNFEHKKIVFSIKDTGIGIEEERIPQLFNLFRRIDHDKKNENAGVGFGLFISQILAQLMHKDGITVKSQVNVGSNFIFSLPLKEETDFFEDEPNANLIMNDDYLNQNNISSIRSLNLFKSSESHSSFAEYKNKNVLIVDDDIMSIMIHKKYVESFGLISETALNGRQALEKIKLKSCMKEHFSIILLDCNMPIMNGFQAAGEINKMIRKKKIPYVPIIALTANVTIQEIENCRESGMEYFLGKPVSKKDFQEKLIQVLKISEINSSNFKEK